jgi:hypothetical protein
MKYTKIGSYIVVTIVAATLLVAGLFAAISTAGEADASHRRGTNGANGGSNSVTNTQSITCVNGVCTSS